MRRIGVGYRKELHGWLMQSPPEVECIEVTAEHFFDLTKRDQSVLRQLSDRYPVYVHGLGLSLGSPGPLCEQTLERFCSVARSASASWVSEHVSFTRTETVDLGHLNPIFYDEPTLEVLVGHVRELSDRSGRPVILENITSSIRLESFLKETEFLNRLCDRAGCGLLLDVTNLYINSRNHGFDPIRWLDELESGFVVQMHIVGYSCSRGPLKDLHVEPIQPELFDLTEEILSRGKVKAITLERDGRFDRLNEIRRDLLRLKSLSDKYPLASSLDPAENVS